MAWNEPGNGRRGQNGSEEKPRDQDPWGKKQGDGPPDLDQIFRQFKRWVEGAFGKKPRRATGGGSEPPGTQIPEINIQILLSGLFGLLILLYGAAGIYIVEPAERAIVTRLGKYVRIESPGPHWLPRLIESQEIVNVDRTDTSRHSGLMLTQDENIVWVEVAVQYRIGDARSYLFNVVTPVQSLKEATESALRQVVGQSTLDDVLTSGRAQIASAIKKQITDTLAAYGTGLTLLDVAMQPAKAPEEVRAAFDDVIKAREEEVRSVNHAEAYANDVIPKARGKAQRMLEEASAYSQEVKLGAEGNTERFNLILPQYLMAPQVTQTRLSLDMLEQILSKTSKVLLDPGVGASAGNTQNLIYLPIDKLLGGKMPDTENTHQKGKE